MSYFSAIYIFIHSYFTFHSLFYIFASKSECMIYNTGIYTHAQYFVTIFSYKPLLAASFARFLRTVYQLGTHWHFLCPH